MRTCKIDGCEKKNKAHGLCDRHYARLRNHGDPLGGGPDLAPPGSHQRWLEAHSNHTGDECLTWPFKIDRDGYPVAGRRRACRVMCGIVHGPAPASSMVAAHSCGKGHEACINPKHLRWATQQDNIDDKIAHGTIQSGLKSAVAKLKPDDVVKIRRLRGTHTHGELAEMFSVSRSTIGQIQRRSIWRDIA